MNKGQAWLSKILSGDPDLRRLNPEKSKPVTAHLERTLDNGEEERSHSFVRALYKIKNELNWQYGYDKMPRSLEHKYAYAEIMGPRGPVVCENLVLGLVLFAPDCKYPAHSHVDITESYYCLSGFVSQNNAGVYPPGSLIFNAPEHEHAISTSIYEPVLLAYAWVGEPETLS